MKLCQGMGANALEVTTLPELRAALADARAGTETVCIVVQTDWHERARLRKLLVGDGDADGLGNAGRHRRARGVRFATRGHQRYLMIPGAPYQAAGSHAGSGGDAPAMTAVAPAPGVAGPPPVRSAMVEMTPTELWNDSCGEAELREALLRGATGATSNPSLVLDVLRADPQTWRPRIRELAAAHPVADEQDLAWLVAEEIAVRGARLLAPIFERTGGRAGRLSIQVSPALYRDAATMVAQAVRFAALAPNLHEAAGHHRRPRRHRGGHRARYIRQRDGGFTVGSARRPKSSSAACEGRQGPASTPRRPPGLHHHGRPPGGLAARVAAKERLIPRRAPPSGRASPPSAGRRALSGAGLLTRPRRAFRNHRPWSALVGGDIVLTIPPAWQRRIDASVAGASCDSPVPAGVVAELTSSPDFRRAYEPDGLSLGNSSRTAPPSVPCAFHGYHDLQAQVRDVLLPDPDQ